MLGVGQAFKDTEHFGKRKGGFGTKHNRLTALLLLRNAMAVHHIHNAKHSNGKKGNLQK